ncbi:MAG: GNAT family N-acetyltransferase [Candidatus Micrarchaeaceae archaeon]
MDIRSIKYEDIKSLIGLVRSIYEESDYFTWFEHEPGEDELNYMFNKKIAMIVEGSAVALVAVDGGRAVGECEVIKDGSEGKVGIIISRDYRRMHIGSNLLNAGEEAAAAIGISTMVAEIDKRNSAAISFFKNRGFVESGETGLFREGHEILKMKKRINVK